ncbi:MAG: PIN domain-containing protein [Ilumatobacter sp.]|uniref:PIN domain-containing protein n=1 Tax=Ilumatobacter sp. TaxID=1967498 RepID=UPI00261696BB|nr:PIN domain-containing protein [Ilumatobacter sp.]MDJ0771317.1 PIN domain-containing protein [Ilumatobacter sp.]
MRLVVDTGVFSASLVPKRAIRLASHVKHLSGNQLFLAAATVAELRFGALLAGWGDKRRDQLESRISTTTVIPVDDLLLTTVAQLRLTCRTNGHPLADAAHANDLWIAASAVHIGAPIVSADKVFRDVPGLELLD